MLGARAKTYVVFSENAPSADAAAYRVTKFLCWLSASPAGRGILIVQVVLDLNPSARRQTHLAVRHHGLAGFESLVDDRLSFDATARRHRTRRYGAVGLDHIDKGPSLARGDGLRGYHCGIRLLRK